MPIMVIYRLPGLTPDAYDAVRVEVGWEARPPAGAISHAIGFDRAGGVETDLWETREDFQAYVRDRLAPVAEALGVDLPEPEVIQLHMTAMGPPSRAYMLNEPA